MIDRCFQHIEGIGPKTEEMLFERGFTCWDDCLCRSNDLPLGGKRRSGFLAAIERSIDAWQRDDIAYLAAAFPPSQQWRLLTVYWDRATFFDIETTGLSRYYHHPTVIASYHNGALRAYCHGEDIDEFLDVLEDAELLVSFNGNSFDLPFVESFFNIPPVDVPHLDLRWIAYHRGYRGGLKNIEHQLGYRRPGSIADVDGLMAVYLYHRWQAGDALARERLINYCQADVSSLRHLAAVMAGLDVDSHGHSLIESRSSPVHARDRLSAFMDRRRGIIRIS